MRGQVATGRAAQLSLRFCAESAAPPAEETVIGSFDIFTASGTQTGQKQELHTQQIRTKK